MLRGFDHIGDADAAHSCPGAQARSSRTGLPRRGGRPLLGWGLPLSAFLDRGGQAADRGSIFQRMVVGALVPVKCLRVTYTSGWG